jgi:hypothetical protein
MYRPKFHSLKGGNTVDRKTLNQGEQCIILYGATAGITKYEHKLVGKPKIKKPKIRISLYIPKRELSFVCVFKFTYLHDFSLIHCNAVHFFYS